MLGITKYLIYACVLEDVTSPLPHLQSNENVAAKCSTKKYTRVEYEKKNNNKNIKAICKI